MDGELFLRWFETIFLPYARPTADQSVLLLLLDSHASHCTREIIQKARETNVILLALVPHTTHLRQLLDVAVYKSLKAYLSKQVKLGQALRGNLWIPRKQIAGIIKDPFEEAMSMSNIKSGFAK